MNFHMYVLSYFYAHSVVFFLKELMNCRPIQGQEDQLDFVHRKNLDLKEVQTSVIKSHIKNRNLRLFRQCQCDKEKTYH